MIPVKQFFRCVTVIAAIVAIVPNAKGQWSTNGSKIYYNLGKVGIGTNNPLQNSHIYQLSGNAYNVIQSGSQYLGLGTSHYAGIGPVMIWHNSSPMKFGTTTGFDSLGAIGFIEKMRIADSGVGLGTTSPIQNLHIYQNVGDAFAVIQSGLPFLAIGANNNLATGPRLAWNEGSSLRFGTSSGMNSSGAQGWIERMTLTPSGDLGIGNDTPLKKLHVGGDAIVGDASSWLEPYAGYDAQEPSTLQISGGSGFSTTYRFPILNMVHRGNTVYGGGLLWTSDSYSGSEKRSAQITTKLDHGNSSAAIHFLTRKNSTGQFSEMVYDKDGRLGIGLTTPAYTLDVAGQVNAGSQFLISGNNAITLIQGTLNTFIGREAGSSITTGTRNNYAGAYAGENTTTGRYSAFFGSYSGKSNTTGSSNTFLGDATGYSNTTGNNNTFVGQGAGYDNVGGGDNTYLGTNAGADEISSLYNTYVGSLAGRYSTGGSSNTFIGFQSGFNSTDGDRNTYVGVQSGQNNSSGTNNTSLGFRSGYNNGIGIANLYIGYEAGKGSSGSYNFFAGFQAGVLHTSGSNNTFLGLYSGYNNTTGSRNVFIGAKAGYNETGSDKLYIANNDVSTLIYGDFATDKVGIGTTSPAYELDVAGTINATAVLVNGSPISGGGSSPWIDNSGTIQYNGTIGVGIANQYGSIDVNGFIMSRNASGLADPTVGYSSGVRYAMNNSTGNSYGIGMGAADGGKYPIWFQTGNVNGGGFEWFIGTTEVMRINNDGGLAVGTDVVPSGYKVAVDGKAVMEEVNVQVSESWPDYVFADDYDLMSISDLKRFIQKENHLPGIPAAKVVEANGVNLGEINASLLKKIEELTLYIIKQEERMNTMETQLKELQEKN